MFADANNGRKGNIFVMEMSILCRRRIILKEKSIRHYSSNLKIPIFVLLENEKLICKIT